MSNELRRLLDDDLDPRVAGVLRTALDDDPTPRNVARAARVLGVSAIGVTLAAKPLVATAATKAGGTASGSLALIALKWLALGALVGGVASAPLLGHRPAPHATVTATPTAARAQSPAPARRVARAERPSAVEPETPPEPARAPVAAPAPAAPQARAPSAPAASVAAFGALPDSSLGAEVALLDTARRSLHAGDANQTLATLDRYERGLPKHALGAEATLLRVQALSSLGRQGEAQAIASRALAARGGDGYACRLAKLAALAAPECPER